MVGLKVPRHVVHALACVQAVSVPVLMQEKRQRQQQMIERVHENILAFLTAKNTKKY